jgi:cytoskeletal protein RodZ
MHAAVIKALEDGRCDEMLTPMYVKSFLKKYAEYLGLDCGKLLSEYSDTRKAEPSSIGIVTGRMEPFSGPAASKVIPVMARAAAAIVALAIAAVLAGKAVGAVKTWVGARQKARTAASEERRSAPAPAKPKKASQPGAQKAQSGQKDQPSPRSAAVRQAAIAPIPKNVPLKLSMKIDRPVRVKVTADGVLLFDTVLERGTIKTITADKSFNIYAAKGEAVEFVLNGNNLGSPGRGQLKNIEITRNGLKVK